MMTEKCLYPLFILCALLGVSPAAEAAETLYDLSQNSTGNNTFTASEAAGGAGGNIAITGNRLTFTHGGPAGKVQPDYFVGKFPQHTLKVGEKITFTFTIESATSPSLVWNNQSMRFGLFDIGNSDATAATFGPASGYRADFGRMIGDRNGFRARNKSAANLFANASGNFVGRQKTNDFGYRKTPTGSFSGSMSLTLASADTLEVVTSFDGIYPAVDTLTVSGPQTFNAFGIFFTKHAETNRPTYVFSRLSVILESADAVSYVLPPDQAGNAFTTLNYPDLVAIRQDLQRNLETSAHSEAFASMLATARASAEIPLSSVMQKNLTAPSGDKHDYYSIGIYLWPNPDTPDNLPYVDRDGRRNPEAAGPDWDGANYNRTLTTVQSLALSYFFTGNTAHAKRAVEHIDTWFIDPATRMNPNFNHAQIWPGVHEGSGWGAIEGWALIDFLDYVQLLQASEHWTPQDEETLRKWFADLAEWFLTTEKGQKMLSSGQNHGVWAVAMIMTFARYGNRPDLIEEAIVLARDKINTQIASDGSLPRELRRTNSMVYSIFCLRAFASIARNAELAGADIWNYTGPDGQSIRQAFTFLAPYLLQQEPWPYSQIGGTGLSGGFGIQLMRQAHQAYQDPVFSQIIIHLLTMVPQDDIRSRLLGRTPAPATL